MKTYHSELFHVLVEFGPIRSAFDLNSFRYQPGDLCRMIGVDETNQRNVIVEIAMDNYTKRLSVPAAHVQLLQ